jgi:hypothetical protein
VAYDQFGVFKPGRDLLGIGIRNLLGFGDLAQ